MISASDVSAFDLHVGEKVALVDDEWSLVGRDIVLVEVEPVPGSWQCVISEGGETRYVSRAALRRAG